MSMSQASRWRRLPQSPAAVAPLGHQPASKGRRVIAAGGHSISLLALLLIHLLQDVAGSSGVGLGLAGSFLRREEGLVQNAGQFASGLPSVPPPASLPRPWNRAETHNKNRLSSAGRQLHGLYGGGRSWHKHAAPAPPHGTPHTCHEAVQRSLADGRERRLGQDTLISDSLYWWDETKYTYLEASDMCSEYGGSLAVLTSAPGLHAALPPNLDIKVKYWIGLFQVPGSAWTWIDQSPYNNQTAVWGAGQPADGNFCTYIQWVTDAQEWQWIASDCEAPAGVLCMLPQNGLISMSQPFSCMQQTSLSVGPSYRNATLGGSDSSQYPHLCAALCRADTQCAAFTVAGSTCQLQTRAAGAVANPRGDASLTVSCLRYGLDFVSMGRHFAQARLQNSTDKNSMWKCMPDYLVNMQVGTTLAGICDPAACADACNAAGSSCCGGACTAFVHSHAHCVCQLGSSPLVGSDSFLGPDTAALSEGYTACLRYDEDWLRMGSVGDPSEVSVVLSDRLYTLHPEPLGYEAAMAACKAEDPNSKLASITSLTTAISVAKRFLLAQPPRMLSPAQGVPSGMYGMWVGLQAVNGSELAAALACDPLQPPDLSLTWADGSPIDPSQLQSLWSTSPDGVRLHMPSASSPQRICVFFSNETSMMRPGLAVAGACSWELPFVCESAFTSPDMVFSPLPPPNSPTPGPQPSPLQLQQATLAGITTLAVASAAATTSVASTGGSALPNTSISETMATTSGTVMPGLPVVVAAPDTGAMMWVQPNTEPAMDHSLASDWCGLWNGSLATLYNATAQGALTSDDLTDVTRAYWINLAVNSTTKKWAWGQPNSPSTSAAYLDHFTDWCQTTPPDTNSSNQCVQLQFAGDCQTDDSWGWVAADCSDAASYMCTAAPKGTPGRYFCADNYAMDGAVMAVLDYPGTSSQEATSYCADRCTNHTWCHAFTVSGSKCMLKARNTTSFSHDVIDDSVAVGCFKYGILWDTLGGLIAVHFGVGSDLTTRYRCIERQNIPRTDLTVVHIKSCQLSDCTAQCFSMRLCGMVVFDHATCTCTLAHNPLAGYDGDDSVRPNITTCVYADDASFMHIGLMRSTHYITPPVQAPGDSGSSGWWDIPGGDISTNSGNLSDINFNNTDPNLPSTNPVDPTKRSPSPKPTSPPSPPKSPPPPPPPPHSPVFSPPPPPSPSKSPPGPVAGNPDSVPSTPPLGAQAGSSNASIATSSKSSFGVPQMVGIITGFCGGVLLLLAGLFVLLRRRRRGARLGGRLDPKEGREATMASIQAAGLSPDLERLALEWVEGRYISGSGCSDGGAMLAAMPALTPALTQEIETVMKQEQEGAVQLSPGAVSALSQLLIGIQASPKSSSTLQSGSTTNGGDPGSMVQPRETLFTSSAGVSEAYSASTTENSTADAVETASREQGVPDVASGVPAGSASSQNRLQSVNVAAAVPVGFEASSAMTSKSGICSTYITLSRLLGAGSFGTVYEGLWRKQPVAVKIIPHSPNAAPRVKNEVELAMQFDHPNVVRSYFYETFDTRAGVGTLEAHTAQRDTQETWIVLEYCSEGSLASRLYAQHNHQAAGPGAPPVDNSENMDDVVVPRPMHERDPCISSLAAILQMAQGVAQGMSYMHSLAICHGDLKCENVLLGGPGSRGSTESNVVPKVGDFGLSRAIGDISSHLSTATVGTVTHMPPELLLSGQLRPSCDVYSFGIMLWQLYTGAVPYAGMRYAEIVYKVAVCAMRPTFPPDTPRAFKQLAEDCWQSDATARPTFEQVVERLGLLLQQVDQLEAERQLALLPSTPSRSAICDAHSSSECSNDITLQSPWIAACPHPSNCGLPDMRPNTVFTANPVFARPGWVTDLDSGSLGANSHAHLAVHGGAATDASMSSSSSPMHAQPSFAQHLATASMATGIASPPMQAHMLGASSRVLSIASPTTTLIPALQADAGSSNGSRGMPAVMYMPAAASAQGAVTSPSAMPLLGSMRPSPEVSPRDPAVLDDSGSPRLGSGTGLVQGSISATAMRTLYPPGTPTTSYPADQHHTLLTTSDSLGAHSASSSTMQAVAQPPVHGLLEWHSSLQPQHAGLLPRRASLSPSGSLQPQALQHVQLQLPPQGPLLGHEPGSSRTPHRTTSRLSASAVGVGSPPGSARSFAQQLPPFSPRTHELPIMASHRIIHSMTTGPGRHQPGIEAHLKLRATSASQAKLGMHALSLLDSFGQAASPSKDEPGSGLGQDAA